MRFIFFLPFITLHFALFAQCSLDNQDVQSKRLANYTIKVNLDDEAKFLDAYQTLRFINHSPDPINFLRFYMYQNAFKNTESTFMKSSEGDVFGDDVSLRPEQDWGWIDITSFKIEGNELINQAKYVHPDDDNKADQTVLEIPLPKPIQPGQEIEMMIDWNQKIPKIFARSGYEKESFYNMVHWFPQIGVWEQNQDSLWDWNCHQAHRRTEFYADFGVYDVSITLPDHLITGASGCEVSTVAHDNGTKTVRYLAQDVIDFAWCAYPHFEVFEDQWKEVKIRLLIPPEHAHHAERIMNAAIHSLSYLDENVGPYPYNSLTILDPPMLGLKAGFMEYPTYITGGSFAIFPKGIRTVESLIAHEFTHQYFMGMIATNEKEAPWLDEGFVTYHEDKIMESWYGLDGSLIHLLGYKINSSSFSRNEYVSLDNPSCGAIARSGWEIDSGFKGITYSKTATMLKTMEGMMGEDNFILMMKNYFDIYSFDHPRAEDFIDHVKDHLSKSSLPNAIGDPDQFFEQIVYGTDVLDYGVGSISYYQNTINRGLFDKEKQKSFARGDLPSTTNSKITLHRFGGVILPVDVLFQFENGDKILRLWSGEERTKIFTFAKESRVEKVIIDPDNKLYLDINLNNNSLCMSPSKTPSLKVASKLMYWFNNIIQTVGLLI